MRHRAITTCYDWQTLQESTRAVRPDQRPPNSDLRLAPPCITLSLSLSLSFSNCLPLLWQFQVHFCLRCLVSPLASFLFLWQELLPHAESASDLFILDSFLLLCLWLCLCRLLTNWICLLAVACCMLCPCCPCWHPQQLPWHSQRAMPHDVEGESVWPMQFVTLNRCDAIFVARSRRCMRQAAKTLCGKCSSYSSSRSSGGSYSSDSYSATHNQHQFSVSRIT